MRIAVVTLGLVAVISGGLAAQAVEKLTVTALPKPMPRLDFGLELAQKSLPVGPWKIVKAPKHALPMQPTLEIDAPTPVDCAMVKTHQHHAMPILKTIQPPANVKHHLKTTPVAPCPVR
jgi:hypothetical protein